ncbi:MAG: hypothetical protein ACOYO1_11385 [Bacteroidales bacterium]
MNSKKTIHLKTTKQNKRFITIVIILLTNLLSVTYAQPTKIIGNWIGVYKLITHTKFKIYEDDDSYKHYTKLFPLDSTELVDENEFRSTGVKYIKFVDIDSVTFKYESFPKLMTFTKDSLTIIEFGYNSFCKSNSYKCCMPYKIKKDKIIIDSTTLFAYFKTDGNSLELCSKPTNSDNKKYTKEILIKQSKQIQKYNKFDVLNQLIEQRKWSLNTKKDSCIIRFSENNRLIHSEYESYYPWEIYDFNNELFIVLDKGSFLNANYKRIVEINGDTIILSKPTKEGFIREIMTKQD